MLPASRLGQRMNAIKEELKSYYGAMNILAGPLVAILLLILAVALLINACGDADSVEPTTEQGSDSSKVYDQTYRLHRGVDCQAGVACYRFNFNEGISCLPLDSIDQEKFDQENLCDQ